MDQAQDLQPRILLVKTHSTHLQMYFVKLALIKIEIWHEIANFCLMTSSRHHQREKCMMTNEQVPKKTHSVLALHSAVILWSEFRSDMQEWVGAERTTEDSSQGSESPHEFSARLHPISKFELFQKQTLSSHMVAWIYSPTYLVWKASLDAKVH